MQTLGKEISQLCEHVAEQDLLKGLFSIPHSNVCFVNDIRIKYIRASQTNESIHLIAIRDSLANKMRIYSIYELFFLEW